MLILLTGWFLSCGERLDIIRELDISDTVRKSMGIKTSSSEKCMKYPVVKLSIISLESASDIRKTCTGKKVVSGFFDSYLSTVELPNYLLIGLIKSLLRKAFSKFTTSDGLKLLQHKLSCDAADDGLVTNVPFLFSKTSSFNGIPTNMSILTLFTLLLVPTQFFKKLSTRYENYNSSFHLLVSTVFVAFRFCPDERLDGEEDMGLALGDNFSSY